MHVYQYYLFLVRLVISNSAVYSWAQLITEFSSGVIHIKKKRKSLKIIMSYTSIMSVNANNVDDLIQASFVIAHEFCDQ